VNELSLEAIRGSSAIAVLPFLPFSRNVITFLQGSELAPCPFPHQFLREGMKKLILAFFFFALPATAQTIAIRAGNLIDPAKGTVSKDQVILVENGKITAVGAGVAVPKDAQVVDLSKEWVMPGLMDAHTRDVRGDSRQGTV